MEVVNVITEIIASSSDNDDQKAIGSGLMSFLGRSMYQLQGGVETTHLMKVIEEVVDDALMNIIKGIVVEGIKDNTATYLKNRSHVSKNPIITIINVLIIDAVDDMIPMLVRRAIKEIVDEYIENLHEIYVYNKIIDSHLNSDAELFAYDNDNGTKSNNDLNLDLANTSNDDVKGPIRIDSGRDYDDNENENDDDVDTHAAAREIQRMFRGKLVRKLTRLGSEVSKTNIDSSNTDITNNDDNNNKVSVDSDANTTTINEELIATSLDVLKPSEIKKQSKVSIGSVTLDTPDLIRSLVYESYYEECIMDLIITEVVSEHTRESSLSLLSTMKQELTLAWRQEDIRKIGECFQQNIMKRLLIQHLVMHISYDFESIRLENLVRGILNRQAASRLLTLTEEAERRTRAVKDNIIINKLAKTVILPSILEDEINFFLSTSRRIESYIDTIETKMANDDSIVITNTTDEKNNYNELPKPPNRKSSISISRL